MKRYDNKQEFGAVATDCSLETVGGTRLAGLPVCGSWFFEENNYREFSDVYVPRGL